jgi:alpha-ketoglutarate-dependent taurine dioxygenase
MKYNIVDITPSDIMQTMVEKKIAIYRNLEPITENDLRQFAQTLGEMLSWDFGNIMHLRVDPNAKNYLFTDKAVPFHWDGAFHQEPQWLVFFCLSAPQKNDGGETLFSNTESILSHLSEKEITQLKEVRLRYSTEKLAHYGGAVEKAIVQTHPLTTKPILRYAEAVDYHDLNPVHVEVVTQAQDMAENWMSDLTEKLYDPAHCYRHQWQASDLVIADNFSLLHGRTSFLEPSARHIMRAQILHIHPHLLKEIV